MGSAEDPALIPERLSELAPALGLTAATTPAGVGVARLLGELARRGRWLVVFDNAEDPRAVPTVLPEGPGQVLITSRNPAGTESPRRWGYGSSPEPSRSRCCDGWHPTSPSWSDSGGRGSG